MVLGKLADSDSVDLSLGVVDSDGLGVFDAFFASLSIILVSEVGQNLLHLLYMLIVEISMIFRKDIICRWFNNISRQPGDRLM